MRKARAREGGGGGAAGSRGTTIRALAFAQGCLIIRRGTPSSAMGARAPSRVFGFPLARSERLAYNGHAARHASAR